MQEVDEPGDGDAGGAGQRPRQCADKLDEDPRQGVFESVAQGKAKASREKMGVSIEGAPQGLRPWSLVLGRWQSQNKN